MEKYAAVPLLLKKYQYHMTIEKTIAHHILLSGTAAQCVASCLGCQGEENNI